MPLSRVVLLTAKYPWGPGEEFLTPELPHWVRDDVEITLMPWTCANDPRELPNGILVDTRLDELRRKHWARTLATQFASPAFWRETSAAFRAGQRSPGAMWRVLVPSAAADLTRRALKQFASDRGPIDLAYSYWFDYQTLGALRADPYVRHVATRAHRYDLYEDRSEDGRLPFKRWMAQRVDLLATISDGGLDYARTQFDAPSERSACFPLGVPQPALSAPTPADYDAIAILSVSTFAPVKRIPELIQTIGELARRLPERSFRWQHAGGGETLDELRREASATLPANVEATWLGQLPSHELAQVYAGTPWNFLLNVSSSEGVPISVMEAMSFGIPAVATDVGGTAELVAPANGLLLNPSGKPAEWAEEILAYLPATWDRRARARFRETVTKDWDQHVNHARFVDALVTLAQR